MRFLEWNKSIFPKSKLIIMEKLEYIDEFNFEVYSFS